MQRIKDEEQEEINKFLRFLAKITVEALMNGTDNVLLPIHQNIPNNDSIKQSDNVRYLRARVK